MNSKLRSPYNLAVYRAALEYHKIGLSFIPIRADGSKMPAFELLPAVWTGDGFRRPWKPYCSRSPLRSEIRDWFQSIFRDQEYGLAIIAGKISGGLQIIDLDNHAIAKRWLKLVRKRAPGLIERLVRVKTPRPGMHVYFRCANPEGSRKLARAPVEKPGSTKLVPKVMIELKGEGGYCLAPPSPASCHPSGRRYSIIGNGEFADIPQITESERQVLLKAAEDLDTWQQIIASVEPAEPRRVRLSGSGRPGDDFNAKASWAEILMPHGWTLVGRDEDVEYWRRPGKAFGTSATTNYEQSGLLYVFSSNAPPFEDGKAYTKFRALVLLEYDGDFKAAAKDLSAYGYGQQLAGRIAHFSRPRRTRTYDRLFGAD